MRFEVLPPQRVTAPSAAARDVDWAPFFAAAGLGAAARRETAPAWNPPFETGARAAWEIDPATPDAPKLRVEAASYGRGAAGHGPVERGLDPPAHLAWPGLLPDDADALERWELAGLT